MLHDSIGQAAPLIQWQPPSMPCAAPPSAVCLQIRWQMLACHHQCRLGGRQAAAPGACLRKTKSTELASFSKPTRLIACVITATVSCLRDVPAVHQLWTCLLSKTQATVLPRRHRQKLLLACQACHYMHCNSDLLHIGASRVPHRLQDVSVQLTQLDMLQRLSGACLTSFSKQHTHPQTNSHHTILQH